MVVRTSLAPLSLHPVGGVRGSYMPIDRLGHLVWSLIRRLRHKSFAGTLSSLAALLVGAVPAAAQGIPTTPCPIQVDLTHSLPEIVSANGRLRGLVVLSDAQKSFQVSAKNGKASASRNCSVSSRTMSLDRPTPTRSWRRYPDRLCAPNLATSSS